MSIYLDSCILIYVVEAHENFADLVAQAMRATEPSLYCISDLVRLECPDALHAATAIRHGCAEIWTGDQRFPVLAGRIGVRVFEEGAP